MSALDTFDWLVHQVWPKPDDEARRFISEQRDRFLKIRNENERLRFIEDLMHLVRDSKKRKTS